MERFFGVVFRYVAPFLMGASMAAVTVLDDTASVSAMLAAASLWFFSNAMPKIR